MVLIKEMWVNLFREPSRQTPQQGSTGIGRGPWASALSFHLDIDVMAEAPSVNMKQKRRNSGTPDQRPVTTKHCLFG